MTPEPSTAVQGVTLILGGTVAIKIIEVVFGLAKTWIEKKTAQKIEQPVHVERPSDNTYVTDRECQLRMSCAKRDLVEWNRRIEDKLDSITTFLLGNKK